MSEPTDQAQRRPCVLRLWPGLSLEQVGSVHGLKHPELRGVLCAAGMEFESGAFFYDFAGGDRGAQPEMIRALAEHADPIVGYYPGEVEWLRGYEGPVQEVRDLYVSFEEEIKKALSRHEPDRDDGWELRPHYAGLQDLMRINEVALGFVSAAVEELVLSEPEPPDGVCPDDYDDEERTTAVESACMNEAWTIGRLLRQPMGDGGLSFRSEIAPVRNAGETPKPRRDMWDAWADQR